MMKTKMKRAASLTVGIVALAILVLIALILSFQLLTERASTTTAPSQTTTIWQGATSGLSLADAVAKVEPEVRQRADDAALFRAEGAWRPGEEGREVETPPLAWTLYYYSPSESSLHAVTVSDAQNFWAPPTNLPLAPSLVTSFPPPPRH